MNFEWIFCLKFKLYANYIQKGFVAREKRSFAEAIDFFDKAIETKSQYTEAYTEKGNFQTILSKIKCEL